MLPRFLPLLLPIAILAGCSAPNNYDSTINPFDEPVRPKQRTTAPVLLALPTRTDHNLEEPSASPSVDSSENVVTFAAPESRLPAPTAGAVSLEVSPHALEMTDEANRLGSLGDVQGKAELLAQAGYSGSPKAFYDLARMYLDGTLPKDMPLAVKYITMAHEAGFVEATRVLGMLYIRGQGVMRDVTYGRKLLELASNTSPRAAREYGQLLTNQSMPHLDDAELGIKYLRDAANHGDRDAAVILSGVLVKAGRSEEARQVDAQADSLNLVPTPVATSGSGVKERALRGDTSAMLSYAQQIMLRKIPSSDPEFTAYCWLSVAKEMGSVEAGNELRLIGGVRTISDKKQPGRLDQCISDLHYQISGRI
uniref:Sel1 repeat family protein n=1 Tax=Pseudomonas fluorescens (strain SBW25) TaxID=216595 RepID=A0A0G4E4W3_PSEFS|nr:SEL1-like repeat protein [Pseudomonas fluorescens]CEK41972.1 hypothetical protein PQBR57_0019 [Pseudomonas fluorescens SBW25]